MGIVELVGKEPPEKGDDCPTQKIYSYIGSNLHLWPLEIDFNSISEDQRGPIELVDHSIDSWDEFKEATILAEKLNHFETVRKVRIKQGSTKTSDRKPFDKQPFKSNNKLSHFSGKGKHVVSLKKDPCKDEVIQESSQVRRERLRERERRFERKRQIIYYYCNEIDHIKPFCPRLRENSFETVVNLMSTPKLRIHLKISRY
ncbi:hypothetical protein NPIL_518141 [Nephila pilipes]|uniref:Uncharacterized protein n=1 Tax=Nephila pilipes TaxID=299642 RepID=A0A8X6PT40_NEPPI|nr:hypothetical protein NPIL_518141 [Nephila pilipes]